MPYRASAPGVIGGHSADDQHQAEDSFGRRGSHGKAPDGRRRDYTFTHAGRQLRLGPIAFWTTVCTLVLMAFWSAGTATYFAFRDDLLTRLIARQADMQYAYEDRIADLRAQIDRISSRQLLDQEQVEQRIEQLARRQSLLDSRASMLTGLPDEAPTGSAKARPAPRAETAKPSPINDTVIIAPAPERQSSLESRTLSPRAAGGAHARRGVGATLAGIEAALDRVEAGQGAALLAMEDRYEAKARRMRGVLAGLGIDIKKLAAGKAEDAVGGPFIPLSGQAGAFERQMHRVQTARASVDRLKRTLNTVPLRKPLAGPTETSSGFGVRLDPFIRAPAMHSGLDFRAQHGEVVRATAAGIVVSSGWNGGYGRMVEVDHGNGFSTRYAHLSDILVREDQAIKPGQIIGRVGSTGRSTGPHLHYETRVDGDAVDPHKFLRAGLRLGEKF